MSRDYAGWGVLAYSRCVFQTPLICSMKIFQKTILIDVLNVNDINDLCELKFVAKGQTYKIP